MYGTFGGGFAAAQARHDAMEPPDWDGHDVGIRECEEVVTETDEDEGTEIVFCDFKGKVDVYYAGTNEHWDCPKCEAEHDDPIPEPDWDDRDD